MLADDYAVVSRRLVSGRPLLFGADIGACLRARGVVFAGPGTLGRLVREHPEQIDLHYTFELAAGVDVLTTLTADTIPSALAQVGMGYRSAAITAMAVERALEASLRVERTVAVAGVLGASPVSPLDTGRLAEEYGLHAARLAAAGVNFILARGIASRVELRAAVSAASSTNLATWAVVEADEDGYVLGGESPEQVLRWLSKAGAAAVLWEVSSPATARRVMARARKQVAVPLPIGVLLAGGPSCVEGYPEEASPAQEWAESAVSLLSENPRVLGGGRGSTNAHTAALARCLRVSVPSMMPPPASSRLER